MCTLKKNLEVLKKDAYNDITYKYLKVDEHIKNSMILCKGSIEDYNSCKNKCKNEKHGLTEIGTPLEEIVKDFNSTQVENGEALFVKYEKSMKYSDWSDNSI